MRITSWMCWLVCLSVVCLSQAQYKFRRPQLPPPPPPLPPPQIFKKSWAPGPRVTPIGNPLHIPGNFPHKRPLFKPLNYRIRRPPGPPPPSAGSMFNVLPGVYKNALPAGNFGISMSNFASLSQRAPPVKDLQSAVKAPQQYSAEYRPEMASLLPHRGLDDDKGPIHTIPAPNLGPASKSYQQQHQLFAEQAGSKGEESAKRPYSVTQVDYATVFNGQDVNLAAQRITSSNPVPSVNVQHQYEVTESNEVNSVPPNFFTSDFNTVPFASSNMQKQQANDVYLNHPSSSSAGSASAPMQTNLQSSMHVGAESGQQPEQVAELHVGQPMTSAARLYEVLNAFPQQLTEQYSLGQQPQIQQHLLQQQLSQALRQQNEPSSPKITFSQPTLHSFNYDEQANKQKPQHQNIFIDQNYGAGKVTADYSLAPEFVSQEVNTADANEQQDNNIEFENPVGHVRPTTYFTKIGGDQSIGTQFYTTLPSREAAEKLAALAAAGNVNSQLIGQLQKQQQQHQENQQLQFQADQPMPANHKEEHRDEGSDRSTERYDTHQRQYEHRQKLFYLRHKIREEQLHRQEEKEASKQASDGNDNTRPLRIFVPENERETIEKERDAAVEDYDYENDDAGAASAHEPSSENSEFGSRINSKNRK